MARKSWKPSKALIQNEREATAKYSQYLDRKEAISNQFGIHSDTVAEHVKAVYIVSEQVDDLYMKGAFK